MTSVEKRPGQGLAASSDHQARVLQAVYEIGETFTSSLRLKPVLERIIQSAMELAQGDTGSVMLLTADGSELEVAAAVGPRAQEIVGQRQPASASVAGRALEYGEPLVLKGRLSNKGAVSSNHPQHVERALVMPLRVTGRLVGVLNVNAMRADTDLAPDDLSLLRLLANQAAIFIENARLYEELARKERRLELFVDRFLRLQAERRSQGASVSDQRLKEAIAEAISGVLRQTISEFVLELRREPETARLELLEKLTDREREVLQLVVEGLINKEIGRRLGLSPNTVKNHVVNITHKLGVADRTQAAVMAIRMGLLS